MLALLSLRVQDFPLEFPGYVFGAGVLAGKWKASGSRTGQLVEPRGMTPLVTARRILNKKQNRQWGLKSH